MTERRRNSEVILRWVESHAAELDALIYGEVAFVFTNGIHPRVQIKRSEQIDCAPSVVPGMD